MCGITGIYNLNNQAVDKELIKKMTYTLRHRGPDDEGFYFNNNISLGHRRLSIIDLSPAGHQPMSNEDNSIWLIFNGEIYNYIELIPDLKSSGHIFKSHCDAEVIIHAYEEYGEDCLNKFNGMWAFALWDNKNQKLFCARDHFGIKPFYYYCDSNQFIFASEIKSLFIHPSVAKKPNNQIIFDYLQFGLIDHTSETFFKNISQLPAAHYLIKKDKTLTVKRYWNLNEDNQFYFQSDNKYSGRFYELFEDAIRLRLRSDVPIGTCLSGGIDSSSIVCVVNKLFRNENINNLGQQQKTFTSCFTNPEYDERKYSSVVIKQTGASENLVFSQAEKLFDDISNLIWHQDEPFGSTSIYAQWNVMKLAKEKKIKVLLDGQGGDEVIAGYNHYFYSLFAQLIKSFHFTTLFKEINDYINIHHASFPQILGKVIPYFLPRDIYLWLSKQYHEQSSQILEKNFFHTYWRTPILEKKYNNFFKNTLYNYLTKNILPALLHYEDRNSMAFSIEARVPFLDHRLVEFMFAVPDNQFIRHGMTKYILRKSMQGILPEVIQQRHDKMGFVTPEDIWFRTTLKGKVHAILNSKSFKNRGYVNTDNANSLFLKHVKGRVNISFQIWRWINLHLWFKKFID